MTPVAPTWGRVHVGDTVRGADGRTWVVCERSPGPKWLLQGETIRFVLRCGEREVRIERPGTDPAPVIASADHSIIAAVVDQLIEIFGVVEVLGEYETEESNVNEPMAPAAPKRREPPTGQWGWYKLPHPVSGEADKLWPRVSTIARTLGDEYGLTAWKLRMTAKGVALRPDLIASAAAADVETDKSTLDGIVKSAMEKAEAGAGANYGNALHNFTQRLDAGESVTAMGVPAALVADVEAYAATLKRHGLTVLPDYSERVIVNPDQEYAGRWDRVVRDRAGNLYVLDLKTGKDLSYSWLEFATQEALYSRARYMCSLDFTGYEPAPVVDQSKALVMHLPVGTGRAQIYGVPIDKGWRAALAALDVRRMRTASKEWNWLVKPDTPADVIRLHLDRAGTFDELNTIMGNATKRGEWTDELAAHALARYDILRAQHAASREELAALWAELNPLGRWTEGVNDAAHKRNSILTNLTTV